MPTTDARCSTLRSSSTAAPTSRLARTEAGMVAWLAPIPAMREELHFDDRRRIRCFADRPGHVHELRAHALDRCPDGEAVVCAEGRLSWRELGASVRAMAAGLAGRGIARGDRVVLLLGNRLEFVTATFALAHLGAIP